MAINDQPFLGSPPKSSPRNTIFKVLLISFVALATTALVATQYFTKTTPFITTLTTTTESPLKICDLSTDKESCIAMVSEAAKENDSHLLKSFLEQTRIRVRDALDAANDLSRRINEPKERAAVVDCVELLDVSSDRLVQSLSAASAVDDIHTWLSSVLTNHVTCLDGLEDGLPAKSLIEPSLKDLILRARTSLAILVSAKASENRGPVVQGDFPDWLSEGDRRLLGALPRAVTADVVVAKDGSGKYKKVSDAVAAAPEKSAKRFVIYVKKGTYKEKVEIGKNKKNLMIIGDGMDSTVITGNLNVVDGSTTFNSATVVVSGDGFIAQDICFQNTAGPQKHQAVALRVSADQCVINRCRVDAYQDTLYAHTNRQFYRDSTITGTVDFIFGNAAVVFQSCKLVPRKPMSGQKNMVTAQGRTDKYQNTGTSIQNCDITASSDLQPVKAQFPTYLGRPWKLYSRTVVMQSNIGDVIVPAGWSEWDKDFALKTLYYGEYANSGPGAGTSGRVKWPGYHIITSKSEAEKFTVAQLIQGGSWLKSTGVAYTEGL